MTIALSRQICFLEIKRLSPKIKYSFFQAHHHLNTACFGAIINCWTGNILKWKHSTHFCKKKCLNFTLSQLLLQLPEFLIDKLKIVIGFALLLNLMYLLRNASAAAANINDLNTVNTTFTYQNFWQGQMLANMCLRLPFSLALINVSQLYE